MRLKKWFTSAVSILTILAAAVPAQAGGFEAAGGFTDAGGFSSGSGFEAVADFSGNEDGSADLVMPGTGQFEVPDLTFYDKVIFVGDSRTVHTSEHVDSDDIDFVASSGQGLFWFKRSGVSKLNTILASEEYTTPLPKAIVFNLGINDLQNQSEYISYMNELAPKLINQNCTLYYVSVNPVDNSVIQIPRPESDIRAFNKALQTQLEDFTYIDTYSYLKKAGFTTTDGLHYNSLTYRKIFDYVMDELNSRKAVSKKVAWEKTSLYWYAFNPSTGEVYKNRWISYEGGRFYLDRYGRLKTNSWIQGASGNYYYVGPTGRYFASQWVLSNGKYYYLKSNGAMAVNQWIDGYYVGSDGARV